MLLLGIITILVMTIPLASIYLSSILIHRISFLILLISALLSYNSLYNTTIIRNIRGLFQTTLLPATWISEYLFGLGLQSLNIFSAQHNINPIILDTLDILNISILIYLIIIIHNNIGLDYFYNFLNHKNFKNLNTFKDNPLKFSILYVKKAEKIVTVVGLLTAVEILENLRKAVREEINVNRVKHGEEARDQAIQAKQQAIKEIYEANINLMDEETKRVAAEALSDSKDQYYQSLLATVEDLKMKLNENSNMTSDLNNNISNSEYIFDFNLEGLLSIQKYALGNLLILMALLSFIIVFSLYFINTYIIHKYNLNDKYPKIMGLIFQFIVTLAIYQL